MLVITVLGEEHYDDEKNEFFTVGDTVVELEHSLISLSKWESKYRKPFLTDDEKTPTEMYDYIRFMVVTPDLDPNVLNSLSEGNIKEINDYINSPESATTFRELPGQPQNPYRRTEMITSELIYYWLVGFNIPFEVETWHLNRLFSLVRICNIKQEKPKKMSKQQLSKSYAEMNAQRRAELGTSG